MNAEEHRNWYWNNPKLIGGQSPLGEKEDYARHYHRAKVEEITIDIIDRMSTGLTDEAPYGFRCGAKYVRNQLLNQ